MQNEIQLSHAEHTESGGPSPLLYHPTLLQPSTHLFHHYHSTLFNHFSLKSNEDTGVTDIHPYYTYECVYEHRQTDVHTHEHTY